MRCRRWEAPGWKELGKSWMIGPQQERMVSNRLFSMTAEPFFVSSGGGGWLRIGIIRVDTRLIDNNTRAVSIATCLQTDIILCSAYVLPGDDIILIITYHMNVKTFQRQQFKNDESNI